MRLRCDHRADEPFARSSNQQRAAKRMQLGKTREHRHALLRRLAEANAGVESDPLPCDAGPVGDVQRARKEAGDVGHDVDRRIDGLAIVHGDDEGAVIGGDTRHVMIALQAPDVIDDRSASLEREPGDRRRHRIDGDRRAERDNVSQHRAQAGNFLLGGHGLLAAIGARRLGAHVNDVGAVGDHPPGLGQSVVRREEAAAVRERVGRDVENTHHRRIGPVRRKPAAHALLRRRGLCRRNLDHGCALRGPWVGVKALTASGDAGNCPIRRRSAQEISR